MIRNSAYCLMTLRPLTPGSFLYALCPTCPELVEGCPMLFSYKPLALDKFSLIFRIISRLDT